MPRKDNDSLEDFFRKAASRPDLQFNEDDWSDMEKRLDQHFDKPAAVAVMRKRTIAAVALVAMVGILTLLLWRGMENAGDNVAQDAVQPPPAGTTPPRESGISAAIHPDRDSTDNAPRVAEDRRKLHEASTGIASANRGEPAQIEEFAHRPATGRQGGAPGVGEPASRQNTTGIVGKQRDEQPVAMPESPEPGFNRLLTDPRAANEGDGDVAVGMAPKGSDQPVDSASVALTADAPDSSAAVQKSGGPKHPGVLSATRFGFSIIAAPDFSMTTGGGAMGPGEAAGLIVHYRVFDRWTINAGAIHNTKKYWGRGTEYHPPSGYWKALTNGVVPDRIDGTCAMYEIPVSVAFDIVQTRRSRLFASAGLSSYLMRSEDYYYKFDTPNPGAVTGWSGDRPTALWFGIGTLSVGFDFKATRSLSFGVEPYLKVPMEGIGWADVDLYSTGLMFAARYNFTRNNKHPPPSLGP